MLIHNEKVRREMNRRQIARIDQVETPQPDDRNRADRVRLGISNTLIALARRIEPTRPAAGIPAGARR